MIAHFRIYLRDWINWKDLFYLYQGGTFHIGIWANLYIGPFDINLVLGKKI